MGGRPRAVRRRPWRSGIGLIVSALLVVSAPYAAAQTGGPVASGDFTGVLGLDGGFRLDVDAGGSVTLTVAGSGPLQLKLIDGAMDGTWSLDATQSVNGIIGPTGATITMTGGGPITGAGSIQGPPGDYRLTGSVTSTNTVEAFGQTATSTETETLDEPLTDVLVLCDQIVGRWDLRIKQRIEEAGLDEFIRGYFSASTGVEATEQAQKIEALLADVSRWAGEAAGLETGERSLYLNRALNMLDRSQRLQAELAAPTPCPPDPTFTTDLALAMQDVLNTLLDRSPGITGSVIVSLALGSGAIGAGSPVPGPADALQARMEADLEAKFEDLIADLGVYETDLIDAARAAQMLGMESLGSGGLSPSDILLVLTGSS